MNNSSVRYAVSGIQRGFQDLIKAYENNGGTEQKHTFNPEDVKDLYPFHKDLKEMLSSINIWSSKIDEIMSELDLLNSGDFQTMLILSGMGMDLSQKYLGKSFTLEKDGLIAEFTVSTRRSYSNNFYYTYVISKEFDFGKISVRSEFNFSTSSFYYSIVDKIKTAEKSINSMAAENKTKILKTIYDKTGYKVEGKCDHISYRKTQKYYIITVYDDNKGYRRTHRFSSGRFDMFVKDVIKEILKPAEENKEEVS